MTSQNITVIDLTDVPDSDDEQDFLGSAGSAVSNTSSWRTDGPDALKKVCFAKKIRRSKLKIRRDTLAEHVHVSLFSPDSRAHLHYLSASSKSTYVGSSRNPYFGDALFAGVRIKKGDFICLYEGLRIPYNILHAAQKAGRPPWYSLSLEKGVVMDALGYPYGGGMANHSCCPNAKLDQDFLRGTEAAPYAYIEATDDIDAGDEIEVSYGYLNRYSQEEIDNAIESGDYIPCRCLRPECRISFVIQH